MNLHQRLTEVFLASLDIPVGERPAALGRMCGEDAALRAEVESLLQIHQRNCDKLDHSLLATVEPAWLSQLTADVRQTRACDGQLIPDRIGKYQIQNVLGRGGMGIVYGALQENPRRTVALKVIRAGFVSNQMLRRFEREAQILGFLKHPGIAQIYEAGVAHTDLGTQSFFAMELCEGRPITEFAREHSLSTAARVELFAMVCDAIEHAHRHGIIHRDIKPGNILVERIEGHAKPKVLDFGVARFVNVEPITTISPEFGKIVGTLQYMSPEQCRGEGGAVDSRSDVYALGVVLYELLSGQLPHELAERSLPEAARLICEQEPAPLSSHDRTLRGDLEAIVAKSLAKDASDRYQSAFSMADDLRRYLKGEPIIARQISALYTLRKRIRRYRVAAGVFSISVAVVAAFAIYAIRQADEQRRLTFLEQQARQQAQRAETSASSSQRRAELKAAHAEAVTAFLVDTLGLADPDITQTADAPIGVMLNQASEEVGRAFMGEPEAEAIVRSVLGRAYASLGNVELADLHLRRALWIRHQTSPDDLEALYEVLWPYWRVLVDLDDVESRKPRSEAIQVGQQIIGKTQPELSKELSAFTREMKRPFDEARSNDLFLRIYSRAQQSLGSDDPLWIYVADQFYLSAFFLSSEISPASAARYLGSATAIYREHLPETNTRIVRTLDLLTFCLNLIGEHDAAERLVTQSLQLVDHVLPPDHWYVEVQKCRLAECMIGQQKFAEAELLLLPSYSRIRSVRGERSGYACSALASIVTLYERWNRWDSVGLYRIELARSLAGRPTPLSMQNLESVISRSEHGQLIDALGRLGTIISGAEGDLDPVLREVIQLRRQAFADNDPASSCVADVLMTWADSAAVRGANHEQILCMRMECRQIDIAGGFRHPRKQAIVLFALGVSALGQGSYTEAEKCASDGLSLLESASPERYGFVAVFQSLMAEILMNQGRHEEAERLLVNAHRTLSYDLGPTNVNTIIATTRMATLYAELNEPHKAEPFLHDALQALLSNDRTNGVHLNRVAWMVVRYPGASAELCELALEAAQLGVSLEPENPIRINTVGVAQYRLRNYQEAMKTLATSVTLAKGKQMSDFAFQAMCQARIREGASARMMLERMHECEDSLLPRNDVQRQRIMAEAELIVNGK